MAIERAASESERSGEAHAPSIEVALATWNSERFLAELLDSLFAQSEQRFRLIVADDGSSDSTMEIVEQYAARHPGRIRVVADSKQSGGALGNFARLIEHASADYLMLCDHYDVWLPNKIAVSLERMRALEGAHGTEMPLLVHTDLVVVDEKLDVVGQSLFKYSKIDPRRNDLVSLLTANVATGCTMIINRPLYERARPVAAEAMMHDHWLALVAATLGKIACIGEPTILYRQHGANTIGAQSGGAASFIERVRRTLFSDDRQQVMQRYSGQAAALLRRYEKEMSAEMRGAAAALANIWSISRWRRFGRLRRCGLGLKGFLPNAALLVVVTRAGRGAPRP